MTLLSLLYGGERTASSSPFSLWLEALPPPLVHLLQKLNHEFVRTGTDELVRGSHGWRVNSVTMQRIKHPSKYITEFTMCIVNI